MYLSKIFSKTSKESTADASSINADLLTRGGFISKAMAGAYSFLPLGRIVLQKIEDIVREEMDKIGAEVFLPSIVPTDNWKKTNRFDTVSVLYKVVPANDDSKRTNDAEYVLNSTHEEVITPLVQQYVESYQDLPTATYQIQTKFRNEARPKSGLMRGREFRMKDLYSFHASEEDMIRFTNEDAADAYWQCFERMGLGDRTVIALASGGDFSKEPSKEFQTICETGEDHIFRVPGTDLYYNREIAPCKAAPWGDPKEEERPREDVVGKGIIGVEELAKFLKIEVERTTKTLLFETEKKEVVAVAVRGDYDVNEEKLRDILGCGFQLADAKTVKKVTGAEVGYAGPVGLPKDVRVFWDDSTAGRKNFECGANKTDEHSINVNFGRDVDEPKEYCDVKIAKEGDSDPDSGEVYEVFRASEVGNLFTLYTKFSDSFGFTFTDKDGKHKPVFMGCYGLGTTRVMGVLAEIYHDENGLTWPEPVAPAQAHIVPLAKDTDEDSYKKAEDLYKELTSAGVECLFDDRLRFTVGERLADADLIGVPRRIVVSKKSLEAGGGEIKDRTSEDVKVLDFKAIKALFS